MKLITFMVFTIAILYSTSSRSQTQNCDKVLMIETTHLLNTESRSKLAWMNLVNESNYNYKQQEASAFIPGYFEGDYSSYSEKRSDFFQQQNYESDEFESRQELRVDLPKGAIEGWVKCIELNSSGLSVNIEDVDSTGVSLRIDWKPSPGLNGKLKKVSVQLFGAKPNDLNEIKELQEGTVRYSIKRENINGIIRGSINGSINGGSYSAKIYVPSMIKKIKQIPIEICACKGYGGVDGLTFWGPKGEPCNGIKDWGTYSENCRKVGSIGKCQGKGGVNGVTLWGPIGQDCAGIKSWGQYAGIPIKISKIKKSEFVSFCSCTGKGNILSGMDLWGPNLEFCGGFSSWGKYDSYCKD